ncbi:MAG: PilZ domain-containing protein [Nitrospirae bacterium]|nr:PilZ domain-containing protein [Nitrospirota bacterium]
MADKREHKRKIRRIPLIFSDGNEQHKALSANLSLEGIFIRTRHALKPGTNLTITLQADDGKDIVMTGVVVRSIKTRLQELRNGMGVKLTSKAEDSNPLWISLVKGGET